MHINNLQKLVYYNNCSMLGKGLKYLHGGSHYSMENFQIYIQEEIFLSSQKFKVKIGQMTKNNE